jgi:hypothetical protein
MAKSMLSAFRTRRYCVANQAGDEIPPYGRSVSDGALSARRRRG